MSLSHQYNSQLDVYLIIPVKRYPKCRRTNHLDNPIVVVPKSNGAIRICLDMRRANESLIRERDIKYKNLRKYNLNLIMQNIFQR